MLGVRVARFIWAHRTVAAGFAALWNFAFIFIGPILSPHHSRLLTAGVPLVAAIMFAILCVVSLADDRRKRQPANDR